jgi:4-amino-4-deoxy-L-arabinose transferase-like glycosyltransferase
MQLPQYLFHKRAIFYILLLCFIVRLALVLTVDPLGSDTVDGLDYHNSAISIINGTGYPPHGSLPFVRPPLYPFLLSIVYSLFSHETYLTARIVNVILDTAACFVFYKLILLVWNNQRTAILASLIYIFNPLFLFFSMRVRVEAMFTLLVATGIYFLIKEYKKGFPALLSIVLIGGVFGLACLCRSNLVPFIAFVPLWFIYCNLKKWKKAVLLSLGFVLGCAFIIAPWSIRNYYKYGEMIVITDGFGFSFWISNTDLKLDDLNAGNYQEYIKADEKVWKETSRVENEIQGKSYKERENHYFNLSIQYIHNNFSTWLWLNVLKFAEFWSPAARFDMQGWKAALTLPFGLLTLFGLLIYLKCFFSRTFDPNILILYGMLFFVATVTGVINWSSVRYRVPLVDAYLIPFGISWIGNKIFRKQEEIV